MTTPTDWYWHLLGLILAWFVAGLFNVSLCFMEVVSIFNNGCFEDECYHDDDWYCWYHLIRYDDGSDGFGFGGDYDYDNIPDDSSSSVQEKKMN